MNWFQYLQWWLSNRFKGAGPTIVSAPQPKPSPVPGSVFDDFDGAPGATPDTDLWRPVVGETVGVGTSVAANAYLDGDSNLVVSATNDGTSWVWGWIASTQTYGYGTYSASIKYPPGTGIDPGFWLLGPWPDVPQPDCGEIDIIEQIGNGKYYCTVHGPMYGGAPWNQTQYSGQLGFDPSADFHTYWCKHQPGSVTFGIDGTTIGAATPKTIPAGASWELDEPMRVEFCIVVGTTWTGPPTAATPNPANMLVDWFYYEPA